TAMVRFAGEETTGPGPHSFFREIGLLVSFAVPLVLLGAGFVGHALRERSAGFAFTAGLIANLTLMAGYALAFVSPEGHLSRVHWVRLWHGGRAGAAFWALAWLASRRWVSTWRAGPDAAMGQPLMAMQIGMALAGNAALLLAALAVLIIMPAPWIRF